MADRQNLAPNGPGLTPKWTSSAKSGVGTALSRASRVWFTISHGILNEVYYPRVDTACIRDLGLVVTDGDGFFSEEKRHAAHDISTLAPGVPAFKLINTCLRGRYRLTKRIITSPLHDAVLQHVKFEVLDDGPADRFKLFAVLAPHLVNGGANNTGWIGAYKGYPMLFAEGSGTSLALACSPGWITGSAGFVGTSDGWQDLMSHGQLSVAYDHAENGNVALIGEVDPSAGEFLMALGFGTRPVEAAHRALACLQNGFEPALQTYIAGWQDAMARTTRPLPVIAGKDHQERYLTSVAVMLTHQPISFPGAAIASLSIPWGFDKGDDDLGGYHLVWPRDLGETAGGLMAAGWGESAVSIIRYLQAVQEPDGHWPQNMWLDGSVYWGGIQLDETAFPILLVGMADREGLLQEGDLGRFLPMVRKAAGYIAVNGPVTGQDRWEEDPGYSPFTLAVVISALLVAARLIEAGGDAAAAYCREVADAWNDGIEGWTYANGTALAAAAGADGYYVRIAPPDTSDAASPLDGFVAIKNRPPSETDFHATEIVSPDALALVRFGLRAADDPRIVNTVKVIDYLLKVELPQGPIWKRYNGDGYGEHEDGSAFNGTGVGRPWPLMTGERAHYELAAGHRDEAERLLSTFENSANAGGLLPEQVWDGADLPDRELFLGQPSGSAMPLVWAHAEHVKLLRSLADGRVFDMPLEPVERYQTAKTVSRLSLWRFNHKSTRLATGKILRIEVTEPASVHWSFNGWGDPQDTPTRDTGMGMHVADLPTGELATGASIVFTFFWRQAQHWEGTDFHITVT